MDAIPYKRLVMTVALYAGLTAMSFAQPPGGRGGPPRGGPGMLLRSDEVRAELELLDDQVEQLREIEEEMRDRMRQQFAGRRGGPPPRGGERGAGRPEGKPRGERGDRTPRGERGDRGPRGERGGPGGDRRAQFEEMRQEVEGRIAEVLTTQQMERLKQINAQQQLSRGGARALLGGPMADALDLSEEQQEMLRERAGELRAEMEKKMEAARAEAKEQLMEILTSEQRAKLDEMTGEPFTMTERPGFDRGRRGGRGRGGEGGPRGGPRGDRPGPPPRDEL